jgi:hypothetical protein
MKNPDPVESERRLERRFPSALGLRGHMKGMKTENKISLKNRTKTKWRC